MLLRSNTYKILVSRILLGLYMLGVLQSPILEVLHLASHIIILHDHSGAHSYLDHTHVSDHSVLKLVDDTDSENNAEHHNIKKPLKKVELLYTHSLLLDDSDDKHKLNPHNSQEYQKITLDIPSPPPDYRIG